MNPHLALFIFVVAAVAFPRLRRVIAWTFGVLLGVMLVVIGSAFG